jgi:hypothetical protein
MLTAARLAFPQPPPPPLFIQPGGPTPVPSRTGRGSRGPRPEGPAVRRRETHVRPSGETGDWREGPGRREGGPPRWPHRGLPAGPSFWDFARCGADATTRLVLDDYATSICLRGVSENPFFLLPFAREINRSADDTVWLVGRCDANGTIARRRREDGLWG